LGFGQQAELLDVEHDCGLPLGTVRDVIAVIAVIAQEPLASGFAATRLVGASPARAGHRGPDS
jgi:hypothetical protein